MAFKQLETARLLIRPLSPRDLEGVHAVFSDAEVMRYVPGGACDRDGSKARLQALIEHQRDHGFSKWAVIEMESRRLIGDCGLQYLDGGPEIELGFHIVRSRWGCGLASEAARACLQWALAERPESVVAIADPANEASIRVLEKIGMRLRGPGSYFGREWLVYIAEQAPSELAGGEAEAPSRSALAMPASASPTEAAAVDSSSVCRPL